MWIKCTWPVNMTSVWDTSDVKTPLILLQHDIYILVVVERLLAATNYISCVWYHLALGVPGCSNYRDIVTYENYFKKIYIFCKYFLIIFSSPMNKSSPWTLSSWETSWYHYLCLVDLLFMFIVMTLPTHFINQSWQCFNYLYVWATFPYGPLLMRNKGKGTYPLV